MYPGIKSSGQFPSGKYLSVGLQYPRIIIIPIGQLSPGQYPPGENPSNKLHINMKVKY